MTKDEFLDLIAEVLEVEKATLAISMSLEELEWDSLSNLTLISLLDSQFGKQIGAQQLQDALSLSELFELVNS